MEGQTQIISNEFYEGLDRDTAFAKLGNKKLYDGFNVDLLTDGGKSSLSVSNHRGNKFLLSLPDTKSITKVSIVNPQTATSVDITINGDTETLSIGSLTTTEEVYNQLVNLFPSTSDYTISYNSNYILIVGLEENILTATNDPSILILEDDYISAQTNLSIIGWGFFEDSAVLISTSEFNTQVSPQNTVGQIWEVTFLPNNSHTLTLKYNERLNLSLKHFIYNEVQCRVEGNSQNKVNVYWTDNFNNPKAVNLRNPQLFAIPPQLLDWRADVNMSIPILDEILFNQGNLNVGTYGLAYRLGTFDGALSSTSPISNLVQIAVGRPPSNLYDILDNEGADIGTQTNKAIKWTIKDIDALYDYIEPIIIKYELENTPIIQTLPIIPATTSEVSVIYSGNEIGVPITLDEFVNPLIQFDTFKTFAQKKNRLYPANVKLKQFKADFDARVYRFNSNQEADLYDENGNFIQIDGTTPDYDSVPTTHDAINPYNDESGTIYGLFPSQTPTDWENNYQFKFQADGVTLGGSGKNISYKFTSFKTIGDGFVSQTDINGKTFVPFAHTILNPPSPINLGVNNQDYNVQGDYQNNASARFSSLILTHARGEVYRYGIVFFDNKARQSFVEWIGDIKIPEPIEGTDFHISNMNSNIQELNNIAIEFTIDTTSLLTNIIGYQIVRVNITDRDKTRFGTGIAYGINGRTDAKFQGNNNIDIGCLFQASDVNGASILNFSYSLPLSPPNPEYGDFTGGLVHLTHIKSPDIDFNVYQTGSANYLKVYHTYTPLSNPVTTGFAYWQQTIGGKTSFASYRKAESVFSTHKYRANIVNQTKVDADGFVPSSFSPNLSSSLGVHDYWNVGVINTGTDGGKLAAIGSRTFLADLGTNALTNAALGLDPTDLQKLRFVSLCRYNIGQYGGAFYKSRFSNVYISAGYYQPIKTINTPQVTKVFGDRYMHNYTTTLAFFHWREEYNNPFAKATNLGANFEYSDRMRALAYSFPCEVSFNLALRYGRHWNKDQVFSPNGDEFARFLTDEYKFNFTHSQKNNIKTFISPPQILNENILFPTRVYSSNRKVDGEIVDNWRTYPTLVYTELEGTYGQINKILNYKERLIGYQERGVAIVQSEEQTSVPSSSGVLQAGTGAVLERYEYLDKETGVSHQFATAVTNGGVYHFDSRLKKFCQLSGQSDMQLSDLKGLSAYFRENTNEDLEDDLGLQTGIHLVYDSIYNRVYLTYLNTELVFSYNRRLVIPNGFTLINLNVIKGNLQVGDTLTTDEGTYLYQSEDFGLSTFILISGQVPSKSNGLILSHQTKHTVGYSLPLQTFESFYGFYPNMYLPMGKRLLSANPIDENASIYIHNQGNFAQYYNQAPQDSYIQFIVNILEPTKLTTARLDTIQWWNQSIDQFGNDVPNDTVTSIKVTTDYQSTLNSLSNLQNPLVKRALRTWRVNLLRDYSSPQRIKPFLRDKYFNVSLYYDNKNNHNIILNSINSVVTVTPH